VSALLVEPLESAGVCVKMITCDHAVTARAIAKQLGIENAESVVSGHDLNGLDEPAIRRVVRETNVFACTIVVMEIFYLFSVRFLRLTS
jgi:magnesium-transporting ATPase (P-type)